MSGTNRNRELLTGGPAVILVEPQLGENIGMVARAMANFGLDDLRLVAPRDGWPNEKARASASRADHVIDGARVFNTLEAAISDLSEVYATTARPREMMKEVLEPQGAMERVRYRISENNKVGILFGRERWGLENHEIALADAIVTFPVNPAFASLNIAQAVLLLSYEWMRANGAPLPDDFEINGPHETATRATLTSLLEYLYRALDEAHYFFPEARRERLAINITNLFTNARFSEAELQTLYGIVAALERRWKKKQESNTTEKNKDL